MSSVANKIVWITGASSGIGEALAYAFAKRNCKLVLTARRADELERVKKRCNLPEEQVLVLPMDIAEHALVETNARIVMERFGKIDVLVNNAGITKDGLLMRMSEEDWNSVIDTNLKGVFNFTKAVTRPMMGKKSGKIVNITSISGVIGNAGQANYSASKAGVIGFTKAVAKELASRNINVNAIAPGFIETEMTDKLSEEVKTNYLTNIPLKRFAKANEVAGVVKFLASDDAAYITGQTLCVDGGLVM